MTKQYIYGAGGHGKVVLDAMQLANLSCEGFIDDNDITTWMGLNVQSYSSLTISDALSFHLAIGNGKIREKIAGKLSAVNFFSIFHPDASIAKTAKIGRGSLVAAQAVVATEAQVGLHCIINHSAVVDHDCIVGDFSHFAPQSCLGGASQIGKGVLIGAGAIVMPGLTVGDYAVVGAGAVVTKNVSPGVVVIGNPAREVD